MAISAFPLTWPASWPRTAVTDRVPGRFGTTATSGGRSYPSKTAITSFQASMRLLDELWKMGVPRYAVVISTNLKVRLDGIPRSDQKAPADPGAAVYWTDPFNDQPRSMAIDRYTKVEMNLAALAATIDAMRAIERHGGAVVLERAFTGFAALPAPIAAGMKRDWWAVLGIPASATPDQIRAAHRRLAAQHHPDKGGNSIHMAEINAARDDALKAFA